MSDGTLLVTALLRVYLENATKANALLMKAQSENRPVTVEEFDTLRSEIDASRQALAAEIARQGG